MNHLLRKAKQVFDGAPIDIDFQCSITGRICERHAEECDHRISVVISKISKKIVGWFEDDRLHKTNARPSKRYLKKNFGQKKEKRRGRRTLFKTNRENIDRDQERVKRGQRRTEKDKREGSGEGNS